MVSFIVIAVAILGFLLVGTQLVKRFFKARTYYYVASMVELGWFLAFIRKLNALGRFVERFSTAAIFLGFGVLGVLFYLDGKRVGGMKRHVITVTYLAFSTAVFWFAFGQAMFRTPLLSPYAVPITVAFGIFGLAGLAVALLTSWAMVIVQQLLVGKQAMPGVAPLIPMVSVPKSQIYVPWHGWISLVIIMVIHEAAHGILAMRYGLKLTRAGLLLLGLLPMGAFVDPEEKAFRKLDEQKRTRIYLAGPMANILCFVLVVVLMMLLSAMFFVPLQKEIRAYKEPYIEGVVVSSVAKELDIYGTKLPSPAYGKLSEGMFIRAVNDVNIRSLADLQHALLRYREQITLVVEDENGMQKTVVLNAADVPAGYIGPRFGFTASEKMRDGFVLPEGLAWKASLAAALISFLYWLAMLSLLIGFANFIPLPPLDGGEVAVMMLSSKLANKGVKKEEVAKLLSKLLVAFLILLFVLNSLPYFV
jgi:membrane-associated protease RseP (regulator of RpoE activity)